MKKNIPKRSYDRKSLLDDPSVEVVLITWPPGSRSVAHDHGKSSGIIRVIKGKIYQDVYAKKNKKFIKRITYGKDDIIVETPDLIHIMGNASKTPSQSLHIYTPKLKMNYFEDSQLKK
jgi:predicted metal-dependent enzyme (double-stranded beta helix superfamily)